MTFALSPSSRTRGAATPHVFGVGVFSILRWLHASFYLKFVPCFFTSSEGGGRNVIGTSSGYDSNLDAATMLKPGWVNIDLSPKADLQLDLRKNLPFADGSCECTYSEHFFEHLDYPDDALFFLRENFRVLAPGGLLTFGVPDAGSALEGYARATKGAPVTPFPGHPSWVRTRMDQINFLFRQNYICQIHQHRYAYDLETLELILADVGFSQIHQREFDPLLDSESRLNGTLYVSARKS